jgi:RNA polymerase sigma factor (sigma-70 family)
MTPIDQLLMRERKDAVRNAFGRLDPEYAEILALKYCHGWSYAQLEQHLELGVSQIANRLRSARNRMKAALAREGIVETTEQLQDYMT